MFQHAIVCNQCRKIGRIGPTNKWAVDMRAELKANHWVISPPLDLCPECAGELRELAKEMNAKGKDS